MLYGMTRTKNTSAALELGGSLAALREERGEPSYREIERSMFRRIGDLTPSDEWIRLAHVGQIDPSTADLVALAELAVYYDTSLSALHAVVATRVERLQSALAHPSKRRHTAGARRRASASTARITDRTRRPLWARYTSTRQTGCRALVA